MSAPLAPAPLWFRAARALVRRLPAGRFRAFRLLAARPPRPFEDRLGPEAGGYRYRCDLRDRVAREACLTGRYAPLETALLWDSLVPGDTFVDVGANFGYFTLAAAAAVGPAGRVLALEPDPRMAEELRGNLRRNALDRVEVLEVAAADCEGPAVLSGFDEAGSNRGVSSLLAGAAGTGAPAFTVRSAPLDALLDAAGVDGVALVKVDVEGAEGRVLRGMRDGLRCRRYRRVMMELHPWLGAAFGVETAEIAAEMAAAGYRGWVVDEAPAGARRAYYGAGTAPALLPLDGAAPAGEWPHVLWARPGAEPS